MQVIKAGYAPVKITGGVDIDNRINRKGAPKEVRPIKSVKSGDGKNYAAFEGENFGGDGFDENKKPEGEKATFSADNPEDIRRLEAASRDILSQAKEDAEVILAEARQQADAVKNEAHTLMAAAEADYARKKDEAEKLSADLKLQARSDGYQQGREEGLSKGMEEGYAEGLKKCQEALLELKKLNEEIVESRSSLVQSYEREIFDTAFAIAQKITVDSLKQKDKRVLEKMVKDASKELRNAKTVKVTLSQLDLGADMETDFTHLEKLFAPTVNVRFEVMKDAESGTLILEDGSRIIDAGVSTQLRMIKELGSGKYRDVPPAEPLTNPADESLTNPSDESLTNPSDESLTNPSDESLTSLSAELLNEGEISQAEAMEYEEEREEPFIVEEEPLENESDYPAINDLDIQERTTEAYREEESAAVPPMAAEEAPPKPKGRQYGNRKQAPEQIRMDMPAEKVTEEPAEAQSAETVSRKQPAKKPATSSRKRKSPTNPLLSKMLGDLSEESKESK